MINLLKILGDIWNFIICNLTSLILLIFVVFIFLGTCINKSGFFSVKPILKYYFSVFEKPRSDSEKLDTEPSKRKFYIGPLLFNFGLPIIVGSLLGIVNPINSSIITFMSTVVSIWIAILFALVAIIQSLAKEKLGEDYFKVVKQAYATVMFECCVSILTVILGFVYVILCPQITTQTAAVPFLMKIVLSLLSIIIYTLLFVLLLTMFMIFKKCNALLGEIIKANEIQKRDVTLINILKTVSKIQESIQEKEEKEEKDKK